MQVHDFEYTGLEGLQAELAAREISDGDNILVQCFIGRIDKDDIADLQNSVRATLPSATVIGATSTG